MGQDWYLGSGVGWGFRGGSYDLSCSVWGLRWRFWGVGRELGEEVQFMCYQVRELIYFLQPLKELSKAPPFPTTHFSISFTLVNTACCFPFEGLQLYLLSESFSEVALSALKAFLSGHLPPAFFPSRWSLMFTFWHWCLDFLVLTTQAHTLESCSVLTRLWLQASAGCTGLVSPGHLAEDAQNQRW